MLSTLGFHDAPKEKRVVDKMQKKD